MNSIQQLAVYIAVYLFFGKMCILGASSEADDIIQDLSDQFWEWRVTESPEYGFAQGVVRFPSRLDRYNEETFNRRIEMAEHFLNQSEHVSDVDLSGSNKLSRQTLIDSTQRYIEGEQFNRFGAHNYITPNENLLENWKMLLNQLPLETTDDYQKLLLLYNDIPSQVDELIHLMHTSAVSGVTQYRMIIVNMIDHLSTEISSDGLMFREPFTGIPESVSSTGSLANEGLRVINVAVVPALISLRDYLNDDYLHLSRSDLSVSSLPGGVDYYRACLAWHTTLDVNPERFYQLGLQEADMIRKKMSVLRTRAGFPMSTNRQYMRYIEARHQYYYNSLSQFLSAYSRAIRHAKSKMSAIVKDVPSAPISVQTVPFGKGVYHPNTPTSPVGGVYLVNNNPALIPKYEIAARVAWDIFPGTHLQRSFAKGNDLPLFRRPDDHHKYNSVPSAWPYYNAYVKGWSLYALTLGENVGFYEDLETEFAANAIKLLQTSRMIADVDIHYHGRSIDQTREHLVSITVHTEEQIRADMEEYIYLPGYGSSAKCGELHLRGLCRDFESIMGTSWDVRAFHTEILSVGPVPLPVLEEHMNQWLHEKSGVARVARGRARRPPEAKEKPQGGAGRAKNITVKETVTTSAARNEKEDAGKSTFVSSTKSATKAEEKRLSKDQIPMTVPRSSLVREDFADEKESDTLLQREDISRPTDEAAITGYAVKGTDMYPADGASISSRFDSTGAASSQGYWPTRWWFWIALYVAGTHMASHFAIFP